jgi:hypothetical protein
MLSCKVTCSSFSGITDNCAGTNTPQGLSLHFNTNYQGSVDIWDRTPMPIGAATWTWLPGDVNGGWKGEGNGGWSDDDSTQIWKFQFEMPANVTLGYEAARHIQFIFEEISPHPPVAGSKSYFVQGYWDQQDGKVGKCPFQFKTDG